MIPATKRRVLFWTPAVALLLATLSWLLRPQSVAVDTAVVQTGHFELTVSDEGEARVHDVFVVSAPVAGLMRRVELEAGDAVTANDTLVARLEPTVPMFLDERAVAEARAASEAAAAALTFSEAQGRRAEAERDFADLDLRRSRTLAERQTISQSDLDAAERRAKTAAAAVSEAQAAIKMRQSEYKQARARLLNPTKTQRASKSCDCILVRSPISGTVLRVIQKSEGTVAAGAPILELGDPRNLEIRVDLLSEDAVRVKPGERAVINGWGGDGPLHGVVRRVEPFGFTKVSALGIEEQRVNVMIDLTDPYERWRNLGHGYRVEPKIVIWETSDALLVPVPALFREGEQWTVYVDDAGTARRRAVTIGHQDGVTAQVLNGLRAGEHVVLHPSDRIIDGTRIVATDRSVSFKRLG